MTAVSAMKYAPIAVFAFKRKDPLASVLCDLAACPEARESSLYIFCDGPRNDGERGDVEAARRVARGARGFASVEVREAPANRGLAASIIAGVTEMCERHGRVIVVEDDLLLSPDFLSFMNGGLERYRDDPRVFQVAGHQWPIPSEPGVSAQFLRLINAWGWAIWADRWREFEPNAAALVERIGAMENGPSRFNLNDAFPYYDMLRDVAAGKLNSWAIRFYATCFLRDGLVLHPARSLASHDGHDAAATHGRGNTYSSERPDGFPAPYTWPDVTLDTQTMKLVEAHLRARIAEPHVPAMPAPTRSAGFMKRLARRGVRLLLGTGRS